MAMWKTRLRHASEAGRSAARGAADECTDATVGLLRKNHGTGLVEFALVLPLLLTLIFGIVEFGRMGMAHLTARHAVSEATRYAVTGRQRTDPLTGKPIARAESIRTVLRENTGTLAVADSIIIVPEDGGGPEDLVTVSVWFRYEYFLPGLAEWLPPVDFTIRTSMKNEPFIR